MHSINSLLSPLDKELSETEQWAEQLNAGSFLNAFFREWHEWHFVEPSLAKKINPDAQGVIAIPLKEINETILVSVKHYSQSGRHRFYYPFHLGKVPDDNLQPLSFIKLVTLLTNTNSLWDSPEDTRAVFLNRVIRSIENTNDSLKTRKQDLHSIYHEPADFQFSEQALLGGHSVHPTPKSRDQFSSEEARLFVPEFGQDFKLNWVSVSSDFLEADSVHSKSFRKLTLQLAEEDEELKDWLKNDLPEDHTLLPAHPWQFNQWLDNPWLAKLHAEKKLINYGELGQFWRATSSVRSIYAPHASFMLKYSLSVRLTNSLRHLLPKEVIRGKEIHEVKYKTTVGQEFRRRFPDFDILTEPAHAAIKGPDGEPLPETMIVFRENPFKFKESSSHKEKSANTELLATLTQDNPAGEARIVNLVQRLSEKEQLPINEVAEKWFHNYLNSVVKPLVIAQSDYGLLFGAHQQNLLLTLADGYPAKAYFRDCQGTGYSHLARELLGIGDDDEQQRSEHHVAASLGKIVCLPITSSSTPLLESSAPWALDPTLMSIH